MSTSNLDDQPERDIDTVLSSQESDPSLSEQDQDDDGGDHSLGANSGGATEDSGDHSLGAKSAPADNEGDHSLGGRSGEVRASEDSDHEDHSLGDR